FLGEIYGHGGFDVENAVELFGEENRQADGRDGTGQERLQSAVALASAAIRRHLPVARDLPNKTAAERDALPECASAPAAFRLNHDFPRGILEHANADVIVGEARFQLVDDLGEHLTGIQRSDGVLRDGVEERKVTGLGPLLME